MSEETDVTSDVARLLGEHQYYVPQGEHPDGTLPDDVEWECAGCAHGLGADDVMEERHTAHMAQVLAEAGLLREVGQADDGWDRVLKLASELNIAAREAARTAQQAQIAAKEPAGDPVAPPEGAVGTPVALSARLRALVPAIYADDGYFGVTALEIGELADEADRLEAQTERDRADLDAAATMRERLEDDVERAVAQCRHLHQEGLSRHDWHAKHCGAVEAADAMRAQIAQIRALATATGPNLSCGGYGIGDDGCFVAGLAQRVLDVLDGKDAP